jgi:ferredoxin
MADVATNCGICIRTCPFNKSQHWSHNLVRYGVRRKNRILDSLFVRLDDLFGYGRYKKAEEFWSS